MYIDEIPNRNSPPAILIRESYRENGKGKKRTIANISQLPRDQIELLRRVLRGDKLVSPDELFTIKRTKPHGHALAVLGTIRKLGMEQLIASKRSRERDLVVALIVERLLHPDSKLAATRTWKTSTVAEDLGVEDAEVDEVYASLAWLLKSQRRIENKLAKRHMAEGGLALYDLSSSSYYGRKCDLAKRGKNRDGKKGLPCIAYGLLTDSDGRPVSVDVYPGNTGDPSTVPDQVRKLRERFKIDRIVLVGDRGMLTDTQISNLRQYPGLGWISALRSNHLSALVEGGSLQISLFDETNLAEISSPAFPGERLVACFNSRLAAERSRKREDLLQATERVLGKIAREVARRTKTPLSGQQIGVKVGKVINRFKMAKHIKLDIQDGSFSWERKEVSIKRENELDGIYVIRTSESKEDLGAEDTVRTYKRLTLVERAFRCLKGVDLRVRPIWLRLEHHVRAHIFLCMLAYYVELHMRKAWAPLLFHDEELDESRKHRDPVAPAVPSESAKRKKLNRETVDGRLPLHSFSTLLTELATLSRNTCAMKNDPTRATFTQLSEATPLQQRALDLLEL